MSEFKELFGNEFFIIDSNNLESVEDKLYGFILNDGEVYQDTKIDRLNGEGTYVLVKNNPSEISIHQDFNGSYGIYVYNDGENFAISNSFIELVEFLKTRYPLSLNKDYADLLMSCGLCSMVFKETLVNEIECIPRNYIIKINKTDKSVNFEKIDYAEHSVDLDSKEGLEILDTWFNKWVRIIRSIKSKTNNIQVDLSGGFDSRVISVLWLCANIDLNKIYIRSFDDDNHSHIEDFKIASQIADEFNFSLNNDVISTEKIFFKDIKTILNMSFYTKLGFHNQLNYRFEKTTEPVFFISGIAGETIREYGSWGGMNPEELKNYFSTFSKNLDDSFEIPTKRIMQRTFDALSDEFEISDKNSLDLAELVYPETRCRNHFGKLTVEEYFTNKIALVPSLDPDLHKLKLSTTECSDNYLLIALIMLRYCPKLLEFDFEDNRHFNPETIDYARKINEILPYNPIDYEFISGPEISESKSHGTGELTWEIVDDYLRKIFNSRKFEMEFRKYFSEKIYFKIVKSISTRTYFPLQDAFPAFSVLKIINDIEQSHDNSSDLDEWFESFSINSYSRDIPLNSTMLLLKYATARIDVKNFGKKNNSIEIFDISDNRITIRSPKWFKNRKGEGKTISSVKGDLKFKIRCVNNGTLKIYLKSPDVKSVNNNRFPIFIDYMKFKVNGKNILKKNILVNHDEPFIYNMKVSDGEIISVELKWLPFNSKSDYTFKDSPESPSIFEKIKDKF